MILIGSFRIAAVASSNKVIWKPPSPEMLHTDLVRAAELRADGGREAEAHGACAAGADPVVARVVLVELRSPHLVLAHVGSDDGFALGELVELVDHLLHAQAALLLVAQGNFFL